MRIAQLSNLFESVPPKKYGGIERIVYDVTEELINRGHDVTLFATGDSKTRAKLVSVAPKPMRELGVRFPEMYALLTLRELTKRSSEFDIIHSHMSEWAITFDEIFKSPLVTTLHGRLDVKEFLEVYRATKGTPLVSISDSQRKPVPDLNYVATVYNGIRIEDFPFGNHRGKYLAFLGRISPEKGTHLAIQVARKLGMNLKIAAKIDKLDQEYFEKEIKAHIDGREIEYIGEVDYQQKGSFLKNAKALLALIQWEEPFGLFFIEAMACGTPVIAWKHGSAPEIIKHGVTGFIVESLEEAVEAVKNIDAIDRQACRDHVANNFSVKQMVDGYEKVYKKVIAEYRHARH